MNNPTQAESFAKMPCTLLKGVGTQIANRLAKIGILSLQDLLFHLPYRYQDRTQVAPIGSLEPDMHAVVEAEIAAVAVIKGKRPSLCCRLWDGTGWLSLRFFYFTPAQRNQFSQTGLRVRCYGETRWGQQGLEMIHPEYQLLQPHQSVPVEQHLTPIYPATEGISQPMLRKLAAQALQWLQQQPAGLVDYLPVSITQPLGFPDLQQALLFVHHPPPDAPVELLMSGIHPAQQRLAFEELIAQQLSLLQWRQRTQAEAAPCLLPHNQLLPRFLAQLPFQLTNAQQRVAEELLQDLQQNKPMLRLVQGDVGAGKTVVAVIAALRAVENNYQAVVMAPTEILAEQHFQHLQTWLQPLGIHVALLMGKTTAKARQDILARIAAGTIQIVVGTHALFQESVQFNRLALIVIDEQHRFGVHQRLALREKGKHQGFVPHQLIMTATPIPRTLAMTAYADLDCSIIDELPPGRTPIATVAIPNTRRGEVIERVKQNCTTGKQAYWVCTLIEESEVLECQAAEATALELTQALPELRVGLIHGRMRPQQKQEIMMAFKNHAIDLLVATTVIEVGVDVPNASLMIIENPERLGLAQLHQLRGRVGRGAIQSHCVLLYRLPLSMISKQRLSIMRMTNDGFEIARQDLELRGPGEVLGTRQTGLMQFKLADLMRDQPLLPAVQASAQQLLQNSPEIVPALIKRWLGDAERYGTV